MIRHTEEAARDKPADPVLAGYRLDPSPRRREAGSLLFSATAKDGSAASLQVSAQPVQSRRARARFRRLARARAGLNHAALLPVREVGDEDGRLFVATEPLPTRSLADLLRQGPLEPERALRLFKAVADGLDAAHGAKLVHRTLSGESALLDDGERVQLDLFGLFMVVGQPGWGDVVRKDAHLHYESPEAVRGDELTPASNVYSLTGLLFHALTGVQPYAHHDPVMITYAHISQPPPKPSERKPELPGGLDAIVARGMAKNPAERPESAGALIAGAAMVLRTASYARPEPPTRELTPPTFVPPKPQAPASAPAANGSAPAKAAPPSPPPAAVGASAAPAAPPPRTARQAAAPASHKPPLKTRLVPLWPLLVALLVGAALGALLGTPGSGAEQAGKTVQSADERAVHRLDDVRFRLRDDLAFASSADDQADVAQRLAMAYGRGADTLSSQELVSAAKRASLAYVGLERAARGADEADYQSARERVDGAESDFADALSRVNREHARTK